MAAAFYRYPNIGRAFRYWAKKLNCPIKLLVDIPDSTLEKWLKRGRVNISPSKLDHALAKLTGNHLKLLISEEVIPDALDNQEYQNILPAVKAIRAALDNLVNTHKDAASAEEFTELSYKIPDKDIEEFKHLLSEFGLKKKGGVYVGNLTQTDKRILDNILHRLGFTVRHESGNEIEFVRNNLVRMAEDKHGNTVVEVAQAVNHHKDTSTMNEDLAKKQNDRAAFLRVLMKMLAGPEGAKLIAAFASPERDDFARHAKRLFARLLVEHRKKHAKAKKSDKASVEEISEDIAVSMKQFVSAMAGDKEYEADIKTAIKLVQKISKISDDDLKAALDNVTPALLNSLSEVEPSEEGDEEAVRLIRKHIKDKKIADTLIKMNKGIVDYMLRAD